MCSTTLGVAGDEARVGGAAFSPLSCGDLMHGSYGVESALFRSRTTTMARRILTLARQAILVGAMSVAAPAFADQSCGDDLQKLAQKREAALQGINGLVAAAHGKQLDPTAFCVRSAPLNQAETAMIAYMEKNKDWCQIPDAPIEQLKAAHAKSIAFSSKACNFAAQMKKMKEQAAQRGGAETQAQPLPAGPL